MHGHITVIQERAIIMTNKKCKKWASLTYLCAYRETKTQYETEYNTEEWNSGIIFISVVSNNERNSENGEKLCKDRKKILTAVRLFKDVEKL